MGGLPYGCVFIVQATADEAGMIGVASQLGDLAVGGDFAVGDAGNDAADGGCDGAHRRAFQQKFCRHRGREEHRTR
ncbi:MAG: hypothetical protein RL571_3079 [Pseudomonadota bacterium]